MQEQPTTSQSEELVTGTRIERVYRTYQRQQVCHGDVFSLLINETLSSPPPRGDVNVGDFYCNMYNRPGARRGKGMEGSLMNYSPRFPLLSSGKNLLTET
ncbi:hypothetical protein QTP88_027530 [Uroleucon formosanum]